ncbi:MAG: hypothetical protein NT051_04505 [Candidatus Micrarchaeota archaeon]|nr:hypothetical protein [Candidatus Micrarchaeota archaeon]
MAQFAAGLSQLKVQPPTNRAESPLLSMLTFFPTKNPLYAMSALQRQQFLYDLRTALYIRATAELDKNQAILSQRIKLADEQKRESQEKEAKVSIAPEKQELSVSNIKITVPAVPSHMRIKERLAREINDYSRGDRVAAESVVSDFESRLTSAKYAVDDLMTLLLLVIEDHYWGEANSDEDSPGSGPAFHNGQRLRFAMPPKLKVIAQHSAYTRLASVREMLRHYFKVHPKDFSVVLALTLGITIDQESDNTFFQERLATELARIGSFALAQKMLAELKRQKKMDTRACLLQIGYLYDKKKKKLVLGKRTCGRPVEAREIIGLLLRSLKS